MLLTILRTRNHAQIFPCDSGTLAKLKELPGNVLGGTVVERLALMPHSKKLPGSIPRVCRLSSGAPVSTTTKNIFRMNESVFVSAVIR